MDDQESARWREWTNILGRVRFGTQKINGRTITGFTIKAVGGRLSTYGNPDGTEVRPGHARIAVDMETSYSTVRGAIKVLERVGLLRVVRPATRTKAAVYRLAIGAELMEVVDVWSPARHALEVEKESRKNRGQAPIAGTTGTSEASELQVPQVPANEADDHQIAGTTGTSETPIAGTTGTGSLVPQVPATSHRPRTTTDQPESEDPIAAVTGPRARDPSEQTEHTFANLRRQYPKLGPEHCPQHPGLAAGTRPEDGQPRCPICRALPKEQAA